MLRYNNITVKDNLIMFDVGDERLANISLPSCSSFSDCQFDVSEALANMNLPFFSNFDIDVSDGVLASLNIPRNITNNVATIMQSLITVRLTLI